MKERIAVIKGFRTPLGKMSGSLKNFEPDQLGSLILRELITQYPDIADRVDEVIAGNVAQPAESMNMLELLRLELVLTIMSQHLQFIGIARLDLKLLHLVLQEYYQEIIMLLLLYQLNR